MSEWLIVLNLQRQQSYGEVEDLEGCTKRKF